MKQKNLAKFMYFFCLQKNGFGLAKIKLLICLMTHRANQNTKMESEFLIAFHNTLLHKA